MSGSRLQERTEVGDQSWLARFIGALLIVVPFIPVQAGGFGYVPPAEWLLGLAIFTGISWLVARYVPAVPDACLRGAGYLEGGALAGRRLPLASIALLAALLVLTSRVAFQHHPLLVDSVVQMFQAQIFASGHLTAPAPVFEGFVATQHMLVEEGRWFAQYPPGHAFLLAVGVLAGIPWLVPVLLSLGTAWFLSRFAAEAWGEAAGRGVLLLIPFAPFFWIMGASFMNHVSSLFFISAFLLAFRRWEVGRHSGWAMAAGLAIGAAGLTRPLTALAVAAVFLPLGLIEGIRSRRIPSIGLALIGGIAAAAVYAAYNAATTGDPMVPGYLRLWGAAHGVGFHLSPWGELHTPLVGVYNEIVDLSLLSTFFMEWPVPALLPAGIYLAVSGGDKWDRRLAVAFLAIPVAYLFYWHRDAYLGPRFLYSGLAFLLPLTVRALMAIPRIGSRAPGFRRAAVMLAALSFAYAALYAVPNRLAGYASSFHSMKIEPRTMEAEAGVASGLVFVPVSWGNRLLARMRQAGVAASTAESAYRRADHCELEQLLRTGQDAGWDPDQMETAVHSLEGGGVQLEASSPNGDPTLRLSPGVPLAAVCAAELGHDSTGYANWLPYLLYNDPALTSSILYLRDLRDLNHQALQHYPGRPAWKLRARGLEPVAEVSPGR
jgi:hypothetical protein